MKNALILIAFIVSLNTINAQTNSDQTSDKKIRISIEAGFGYRTGALPDDLGNGEGKAHLKRLLSGFNIEGHFSYFLKSNLGLGVTYSQFFSKSEITIFDIIDNTDITLIEDTSIAFIAPELSYRFISNNEKHSFISSFNIGLLNYNNDISINSNIVNAVSGSTLGVGLGLNYDYHISPTIAIGAGLNHISGVLNKITVNDMEIELEDDKENISRLNINGGIRFYF